MTPETLEWLSLRAPGFVELSEDEKNVIVDFSFLWSLFESTKLNGNCNVKTIRDYVVSLGQNGQLQALVFEPYLEYLKNRYYINGDVTEYFNGLHLNRSGNPVEVITALSNEDASKEEQVIGCLIILYRLRNNLFHGEKWQYQLQGQFNNFLQANGFIKNLMKL